MAKTRAIDISRLPISKSANFKIVAFLDPYQMHIVAHTIQDRGALLYDPVMTLRSHIPSSNDPSLQASLIVKHLKK